MSDDNIIKFGSLPGGKSESTDKDKFPSHPYVIEDVDGDDHFATGYLIFTSHHVCIMEEGDNGPVTALMVPLDRVKLVYLVPEDAED